MNAQDHWWKHTLLRGALQLDHLLRRWGDIIPYRGFNSWL